MSGNYIPKSRKSAPIDVSDSVDIVVSDNLVPTLDNSTDTALSTAFQSASEVLAKHDASLKVLSTTHRSIPDLLRQRLVAQQDFDAAGDNATRDRLARIDSALFEQRRQRRGAVATLTELESPIRLAITGLTTAKSQLAERVLADFSERYTAAFQNLQQLWQEAEALGLALRIEVPTPIPARISTHVARAGSIEKIVGEPVAVTVDSTTEKLADTFAKLERGLQTISGIHTDRDRTSQLAAKERNGDATPLADGDLFEVVRTVTNQIGLLEFTPGTLIDTSLCGKGVLQRLLVGRSIRRLTSSPGSTTGAMAPAAVAAGTVAELVEVR